MCILTDMAPPAKRSPHLQKALRRIVDEQFDGNYSKLARAVAVNPSTAKRWLTEGMIPRADTLARICRKCHVSSEDLLGEDAQPSNPRISAESEISGKDQAGAVDWLVQQGEDPDSVALAASLVARRLPAGEHRPKLWWAAEIITVMRELG